MIHNRPTLADAVSMLLNGDREQIEVNWTVVVDAPTEAVLSDLVSYIVTVRGRQRATAFVLRWIALKDGVLVQDGVQPLEEPVTACHIIFLCVTQQLRAALDRNDRRGVYAMTLLLQSVLSVVIAEPSSKTRMCSQIPQDVLISKDVVENLEGIFLESVKTGDESLARATNLTRETWNCVLMVLLASILVGRAEFLAWDVVLTLRKIAATWRQLNRSHGRQLMCLSLQGIDTAVGEMEKTREKLRYAAYQNPHKKEELEQQIGHVDKWSCTRFLTWLLHLFDGPTAASSTCVVPSLALRTDGGLVASTFEKYESLDGIVRDGLVMLAQFKSDEDASSNDDEVAAQRSKTDDLVIALGLLLGKVPEKNCRLYALEGAGKEFGSHVQSTLVHNVLRQSKLAQSSYVIASHIVSLAMGVRSAAACSVGVDDQEVTLDSFLPILEERDSASHCVVSVVADLAVQKPSTVLPRLVGFLSRPDTSPSLRRNVLDVIERIITSGAKLSPDGEETLSECITAHLCDEELQTRCAAVGVAAHLSAKHMIPRLLALAGQRDSTGNLRGAALTVLAAIAEAGCGSVEVIRIAVEASASMPKNKPRTPSDLIQASTSTSLQLEEKSLLGAVVHVVKHWSSKVTNSMWSELCPSLVELVLSMQNEQGVRAVRALSAVEPHVRLFPESIISGFCDIIEKLAVDGPQQQNNTFATVQVLLCLNTFERSFFRSPSVVAADRVWAFVKGVLDSKNTESSYPDDVKKLAATVLARRPLTCLLSEYLYETNIEVDGADIRLHHKTLFYMFYTIMSAVREVEEDVADARASKDVCARGVSLVRRVLAQLGESSDGSAPLMSGVIDTCASLILLELKYSADEAAKQMEVRSFIATALGTEAHRSDVSEKSGDSHRTVAAVALQQALHHMKTSMPTVVCATLGDRFQTFYCEIIVEAANKACRNDRLQDTAMLLRSMFYLAHSCALQDVHASAFLNISNNAMRLASPELQFEGVKLFGALLSNEANVLKHHGDDDMLRCLLERLHSFANVHSIPQCRQLSEQLTALLLGKQ